MWVISFPVTELPTPLILSSTLQLYVNLDTSLHCLKLYLIFTHWVKLKLLSSHIACQPSITLYHLVISPQISSSEFPHKYHIVHAFVSLLLWFPLPETPSPPNSSSPFKAQLNHHFLRNACLYPRAVVSVSSKIFWYSVHIFIIVITLWYWNDLFLYFL